MTKFYVFLGIFFDFLGIAHAQNVVYAHAVVAQLCSPAMAGRGYVRHGHKKAAQFIAQQMDSLGLQKMNDDFMQPFRITVNTFAKTPKLAINGKNLVAGYDFLVNANSGSGRGSYPATNCYLLPDSVANVADATANATRAVAIWAQPAQRRDQMQLAAMLAKPDYACRTTIEITPKLTWTLSQNKTNKTAFSVRTDALDSTSNQINTIDFAVRTKLKRLKTQNVYAVVAGSSQPDSFVVVCAHYDHLGMLGSNALFCGANDNAGGVAMLLDLAQYFVRNPQPYSLVFVAFGAEELGLLGSSFWVENPPIALKKIKFVLNLDLVTTGENGITVVNATNHLAQFERLKTINTQKYGLKKVAKRSNAPNSDHYPFTQKGVAALFVYAEGDWQHYHDVNDCPPVGFTKYTELFGLFKDFLSGF